MQLLLIVDLLRVKIEFVSIEQPLQEERLGVKKRVVSRLDFYAGIWHNFSYSKSDMLLARDEMCIVARNTNRDAPHSNLDVVQLLRQDDLQKCHSINPYCADALEFFNTGISVEYILVLFGDKSADVHMLPYVTKARKALSRQGVLWPLNVDRHFGLMRTVKQEDTPWERKKNKLIWRGADTGYAGQRKKLIEKVFSLDTAEIDMAFGPVLLNAESRKFSREWLTPSQLMENKYLLSLDGNDVASGLKWMLYSNSVVFMPETQFETWGMESALLPYIHYIPLHSNLSNLADQLKWARENNDACKSISLQATSYMQQFYGYAIDRGRSSDVDLKRQLVSIYQRAFSKIMENFTLDSCLA